MRKAEFTRLHDVGDEPELADAVQRASFVDTIRSTIVSVARTLEPETGSLPIPVEASPESRVSEDNRAEKITPKVKRDVQTLLRRLKQSDFREGASRSRVAVEWINDHCPTDTDMDTVKLWNAAMMEVLAPTISASNTAKNISEITMASLSLFDTFSDAFVVVYSFWTQPQAVALLQASILVFSLMIQAVIAHVLGQGKLAVGLSLLGIKPALEAYNNVTNQPEPPGQKMSHPTVASLTRATEVATESLPLGVVQLGVLLTTEWKTLATAQLVSLTFSIAAVAYIGAQTNRLIDTSSAKRQKDAVFNSFYPIQRMRAFVVAIGDTMLCGGYCAASFVSLSTLTLAAPIVTAVWLPTECSALMAWRALEGEWRTGVPGMEGAAVSFLAHVVQHLASLAYPMHLGRVPGYNIGPHRYACLIAGRLLVINPCQFALGLWLSGEHPEYALAKIRLLSESTLTYVFITVTSIALVGAKLMSRFMNQDARHTFYQHLTAKDHILNYHWNKKTTSTLGHGQEAARVQTILEFAPCYLPQAQVRVWLAEKWPAWAKTPPSWFTGARREQMRRQVPHLLPIEAFADRTDERERASATLKSLTEEVDDVRPDPTALDLLAEAISRASSVGVDHHVVRRATQVLQAARWRSVSVTNAQAEASANALPTLMEQSNSNFYRRRTSRLEELRELAVEALTFDPIEEAPTEAPNQASSTTNASPTAASSKSAGKRKASCIAGPSSSTTNASPFESHPPKLAMKEFMRKLEVMSAVGQGNATASDERLNVAKKSAIREWMQASCPERVPRDWLSTALEYQAGEVINLLGSRSMAKAVTVISMTAISLGDTFSDLILVIFSFSTLPFEYAATQASVLAFSQIMQAALSLILGQGALTVTLALFGLKPAFEAYREITNQPKPQTQKMSHKSAASLTRACEVAFESLPMGLYQLGVMLATDRDKLSAEQVVSFALSIIAVAYIGAQTNRLIDINEASRIFDNVFFSFYPQQGLRAYLVELGDTMLCGGYCAASFLAFSTLTLAAPMVTCAWLPTECGALLAWRALESEWRTGVPGMQGAAPSIFSHVVEYLTILAYPMHIGRLPGNALGYRYGYFIAGHLCVINPCLLTLGLHLSEKRPEYAFAYIRLITRTELEQVFYIATVITVLGATLLFTFMNPEARHTFYRRLPAREHILNFHWHQRTTATIGEGHDAARAQVAVAYAACYLPEKEVKAWLADNWQKWVEAPPPWFTQYWQRRIKRQIPHLLPDEVFGATEFARATAQLERLLFASALGTDVEALEDALTHAHEAGVNPALLEYGREKVLQAKDEQREAHEGTECCFWLLDANFVRTLQGHTLPMFQQLQCDHPGALKLVKLSLADACAGSYQHSILAVSHRWETPEEPDGGGVQAKAIRDFLNLPENRGVKHVFYDYSCMAQGERTDAENREFETMLPNINIMYLGGLVLVLMDLSYMSRFWTQFEAWLALQKPTAEGLVSAPWDERRCTIRCLYNAPRTSSSS